VRAIARRAAFRPRRLRRQRSLEHPDETPRFAPHDLVFVAPGEHGIGVAAHREQGEREAGRRGGLDPGPADPRAAEALGHQAACRGVAHPMEKCPPS
jgi:hypothetical protein